MGAFEVAGRLLRGVELSPGQLAQLRAIDRKYQERLHALLYPAGGEGAPAPPGAAPARREPTGEEVAALDAMVTSDLLAMLTPEQRRDLPSR
jgi:hypothetical protein